MLGSETANSCLKQTTSSAVFRDVVPEEINNIGVALFKCVRDFGCLLRLVNI